MDRYAEGKCESDASGHKMSQQFFLATEMSSNSNGITWIRVCLSQAIKGQKEATLPGLWVATRYQTSTKRHPAPSKNL